MDVGSNAQPCRPRRAPGGQARARSSFFGPDLDFAQCRGDEFLLLVRGQTAALNRAFGPRSTSDEVEEELEDLHARSSEAAPGSGAAALAPGEAPAQTPGTQGAKK